MLVLSRYKNQKIIINNGLIEIAVVEIRHDKVRLGISAPGDWPVNREEVQIAIERTHGKATPLPIPEEV